MNFTKHIQFLVLTLIPVSLLGMEQPLNSWIQEARSGKHYGSWMGIDRTGKPVIVEGEIISRNGRIISSESDLKKLASVMADVMQAPGKQLDSLWYVRYYRKVAEWYTGKDFRDRICDQYIEKLGMAMLQGSGDLYYIFTISELRSDGGKELLGSIIFDIKQEYRYWDN